MHSKDRELNEIHWRQDPFPSSAFSNILYFPVNREQTLVAYVHCEDMTSNVCLANEFKLVPTQVYSNN
ncbi:hypothetical protein ACMD2_19275 [Ananas comosus]|uniref:Uncharacterized protein n=1 Tax=Ananas comosus TaxID=4615 RepID=A0A199VVS3_ANACO|nr:hypothetical protein ACMD2_19275 [Ananas comosus]